jgi:hypothetical protein
MKRKAYTGDVLVLVERSQAHQAVEEIDELLTGHVSQVGSIGIKYLGKDQTWHCPAGLHVLFQVTAPAILIQQRTWERANNALHELLHHKFSVPVHYSILLELEPIEGGAESDPDRQ